MINKSFAVGIVIRDRWVLTFQTLMSLYNSEQKTDTYDLFLIDNGSSPDSVANLKDWIKSSVLPVKNAYFMSEMSISQAWNLFLAMTKEYEYRVKMDNDVVILGTASSFIVPKGSDRSGMMYFTPDASNRVLNNKRKRVKMSSRFLDHLQDRYKTTQAEIISLVPVTPGDTFNSMHGEVYRARYKGLPYLFGACMLITKKCFDTIGYFDERLPRRIDIEYSQRAIRNNINIAYHDQFWVYHIGARNSTELKEDKDFKYQEAMRIDDQLPKIESYSESKWEKILPSIHKVSSSNVIVNIS